MPKGTKVHRCVENLKEAGVPEDSAIAICQDSTGQNFKTGESLKKKKKKGKKSERKEK